MCLIGLLGWYGTHVHMISERVTTVDILFVVRYKSGKIDDFVFMDDWDSWASQYLCLWRKWVLFSQEFNYRISAFCY